MEAVRQKISSILTLDSDTIEKLLAKLVEIGVTNVGDLADVEIDDISPEILLPVPARKLIRVCKSSLDPAVQPSTSSVSSTPARPSRHQALQQLQATPSRSDQNWHITFDVVHTINNMLISTESLLSQQAAKALTEDQPISSVFRNEIVRCLVIDIMKENTGPAVTRAQLNVVAEKMVTKYAKLKDELEGCCIGNGYASLRNQLENRLSYLKRPASTQRKSGLKRRLTVDEDQNSENQAKKAIRDGYGCVDFLPVHLPEGESDESLSEKQGKLKELFKGSWNDAEVSNLMSVTYILQRQDLVGRNLNVAQVKEEWPFLLEPKFMLKHLERLLGFNVVDRLEQGITEKTDTMYEFLSSKSSTRAEVKMLEANKPAIEVIPMLMTYFGEKKEVVFLQYEFMPDLSEQDRHLLPETPCLLFEGDKLHSATEFQLVVDRVTVTSSVHTPLVAVALLFGSYFAFNISYPTEAAATLEFIQRVLLRINPSSGTKVKKTKGKKARSGVHEKVLSIVKDIAFM